MPQTLMTFSFPVKVHFSYPLVDIFSINLTHRNFMKENLKTETNSKIKCGISDGSTNYQMPNFSISDHYFLISYFLHTPLEKLFCTVTFSEQLLF